MLSWLFGSSEEEESSSGRDYHPPPAITGCSSLNFTRRDSWEGAFVDIQRAFHLARGAPPSHHDDDDQSARGGHSAVQVPFEVLPDVGAVLGNALIAKEAVEAGTVVWKDWHYGRFRAEQRKSFYRFLEQLSWKEQCLVLSMTHASYDGRYLEVTMDEGNFIQDAQREDQVNLDLHCVALRDIAAGERFYMNFTEYIGYDHDIDWFDDLKYEAFREAKLRGGAGVASPSAAMAWSERPQGRGGDDGSSNNHHKRTPVDGANKNGYPGPFWPTLVGLVTFLVLKKATASSRQAGVHKNKMC